RTPAPRLPTNTASWFRTLRTKPSVLAFATLFAVTLSARCATLSPERALARVALRLMARLLQPTIEGDGDHLAARLGRLGLAAPAVGRILGAAREAVADVAQHARDHLLRGGQGAQVGADAVLEAAHGLVQLRAHVRLEARQRLGTAAQAGDLDLVGLGERDLLVLEIGQGIEAHALQEGA